VRPPLFLKREQRAVYNRTKHSHPRPLPDMNRGWRKKPAEMLTRPNLVIDPPRLGGSITGNSFPAPVSHGENVLWLAVSGKAQQRSRREQTRLFFYNEL